MAKNITLMGASYSDVPAVTLPQTGGGTATFYDASGSQTITTNGTYDVTTLAQAVVNVSGGGGSDYELLAEEEFTVNTTSTSQTSIGTISFNAIPRTTILYVSIRDKAGPRNGYFYGYDAWYMLQPGTSSSNSAARMLYRLSSSGAWTATTASYGVYPYTYNPGNGTLTIYRRYNSTNSLTINGTFAVKVYGLKYPTGTSAPWA